MNPDAHFELLLFSTKVSEIKSAMAAGIDGVIVDWEWIGKENRQAGADTEVNRDTLDDLERVRSATDGWILCRLNRLGDWTRQEVQAAIARGADELFLPMVENKSEVEKVADLIGGRAHLSILVETINAVEQIATIVAAPISRVYVGLNDLAIARRTPNIFVPLIDGTMDALRDACGGVQFGFGGLTVPEGGRPIPCRLLMAEMARLRCEFSFLRRSFKRDMASRHMALEIPRIRRAVEVATLRTPDELGSDRADLVQAINQWPRTTGPLIETVADA